MAEKGGQLSLPMMMEFIPRGDGSFIAKPKPVASSGETWVSVKKAREIIGGGISRSSVELLGVKGMIVTRRPTPQRVEMLLSSIEAYKEQIRDSEFWEAQGKGRKFLAKMQKG